ncbi:transmembrane protein, putative (macronuclear) [Tetrahymena thermophila SB210]|uniref:Transmembrane protein, putative n=1 Tax=Tetrahymena thermophila (strain SB210) TaxID=312017 RepID=I7MG83_TETTS|nr:transmembrane protein, putative [Tetrahymena thermophila SB210]EAS01214.2 transmembrane protein, putative [Tetrahymena thermophila SB210]|eukprot:XP_001021459.2 transmembrane protein, putative [Tetrahymena thermophila SB210]
MKQNDKEQLQGNHQEFKKFSYCACFWEYFKNFIGFLLKMIIYYGSIVADIYLCIQYWNQGKHFFGVLTGFMIICHIYKTYEIYVNEHRLYGLKAFFEFLGFGQLLRYWFQPWYMVDAMQIQTYQGIMEAAPSFMINILSIFYENKPLVWNVSNDTYQQAQVISFSLSIVCLFYSNYCYFYIRYEDFKQAGQKMKALFAVFNFGEYTARVCSWGLAAYYGGQIFVWTIIGVDLLFAIIASCFKLSDHKLVPFYDYVFCFRMYDCYLFYGNQFDSRNYVNLKEFERFGVQLAVIIFVIYQLSTNNNEPVFFYAMLYVCVIGFIINFIYNVNRLLYKKDDESEIIKTYKRMIENLEQDKVELNLKIRHIVPQQQKDEENKATLLKLDEENTQMKENLNTQIQELQQQMQQLDEKLKQEESAKKEIEQHNAKLLQIKLQLEEDIKSQNKKIEELTKSLQNEQKTSENLRGDKAIFQQHLAEERKQNDELKRINFYLQNEQEIPPFYAENMQKQLDQIKKQNREAEERWKQLEQMYQKRENELKEQLYKQANHDIEINSYSSATHSFKKQNEAIAQKLREKEAQLVVCQNEIKELRDEVKKLKQINQNLNDKLQIEEKLTNQQEIEMKLLKEYNPEEYSQNQHQNLSLTYLATGSVTINKFEDYKLCQRDTNRIVFNNFINMNLIEKINQTVKFPYYFQFNFSKKSSLFNTGQNYQNELFIFSTLATKNYPQALKVMSILASNWVNVTSESFQSIFKIIKNCTSLKVLELNLENWETTSEEVKVNGFCSIFTQIVACEYLLVLHLNLSGLGNLNQDIWDSLSQCLSVHRRLGELSLDLSKRGSQQNGIRPQEFDSLCSSISKLIQLENLSFNFSEWRDNQLNVNNVKNFGQMLKQLPRLRYFRLNLKYYSNYNIEENFFNDLIGDLIKQKNNKLQNFSLTLDGFNEYKSELNDGLLQSLLKLFQERNSKINQIIISADYIKNCSPNIISFLRRELNILCQYLSINYQIY